MHLVCFITSSAKQTQRIGILFAKTLGQAMPFSHALICALEGDLGTGKTTFMQGLAQGFGIARHIISPTFLLMRSFRFGRGNTSGTLIHFDCWRIGPQDVIGLGFRDIAQDRNHIVCLEWADRVKSVIPRDAIKIRFAYYGRRYHKITFVFP